MAGNSGIGTQAGRGPNIVRVGERIPVQFQNLQVDAV